VGIRANLRQFNQMASASQFFESALVSIQIRITDWFRTHTQGAHPMAIHANQDPGPAQAIPSKYKSQSMRIWIQIRIKPLGKPALVYLLELLSGQRKGYLFPGD
jgi:hypothetical protein